MPTHPNIELRSEEIQTLLTKIPSTLVRWGATALFLCLTIVLVSSFFIKIPEEIKGSFLLSAEHPGEISISTKDSGTIKKGQRITIALENYPASKFGNLSTTVDRLSFNEENNTYIVHTPRLDSLTTNFGINIQKLPLLTGQAAILVDEKRAIQRILPFLNL